MYTVTAILWADGEVIQQKSFLFKEFKTANKFMKSKYKPYLNRVNSEEVIASMCLTDYFEINFSNGYDVTYWLTETQIME